MPTSGWLGPVRPHSPSTQSHCSPPHHHHHHHEAAILLVLRKPSVSENATTGPPPLGRRPQVIFHCATTHPSASPRRRVSTLDKIESKQGIQPPNSLLPFFFPSPSPPFWSPHRKEGVDTVHHHPPFPRVTHTDAPCGGPLQVPSVPPPPPPSTPPELLPGAARAPSRLSQLSPRTHGPLDP